MIKALLAAASLSLLAASAQASGLDDFKAANAAVEKGQSQEAVRLFTQALAAGDLSADDQFTAHKVRGREYTARSMIADAFQRRDEAKSLRDKAVADFTDALKQKTDDETLYSSRGEAHYLSGEYDAAIADFDSALKLKSATITLVQRAASKRGKGDYDAAAADYTAAIASDAKDSGESASEIYNERGMTYFLAAHFDKAAADFDKAVAVGTAAHTGDVLWLPYQAAWLHIARARGGENDAEELARNAQKVDLKQWPGTLLAYFLGQTTLDQISQPSSHGAMGHGRACNMSTFSGELALVKKDSAEAARQFDEARAVCNVHTTNYLVAGVELKRLGK